MSRSAPPPDSVNKRSSRRVEVDWDVDCEGDDTFLYASLGNVSELGIFVLTETPFAVGTYVQLKFAPRDAAPPFVLNGRVQWVNEVNPNGENINPGMGLQFLKLTADQRERLVDAIHAIAYLRSEPPAS
ncbi:MAG: TIGR02266 family protein [Myxococcales bacterium]|nr:TIGR02266 family protein [Myxococcales bacterium]